MTRYACTNPLCPRRAPVAAAEPPVCYTCGERMAEASHGEVLAADLAAFQREFGRAEIAWVTPDANMPRIADLVNVTIDATPTGRPLLQPIDDLHLHSDNIHWRDNEPVEYSASSTLALGQRLAEAAAAVGACQAHDETDDELRKRVLASTTPERAHADARKVIDLCSLLRSLPDVQRVALVEYERGDVEVFVDGGRDEQILAHLFEAAASYEMRGQIAATVTDSSGANLRGVAFSRGAQSVELGPVARGVRYATGTWGSGYATSYRILGDDRDITDQEMAERNQRIVDLSA